VKQYKSKFNNSKQQILEKASPEIMKSFNHILSFKLNGITLANIVAESMVNSFKNNNYEDEEIEKFTKYLYRNINNYLFE
jgi:hypothetical protein